MSPLLTRGAPTTRPPHDGSSRSPDGPPPADDRLDRRRRARVAAMAAIVLALGAGAAVVVLQSGTKSHNAASGGVPPGDTTATVERRTLVERSQVDGTLGYGGTLELYDRLSGTFTWLPAVGAVIRRGGTLFRIDNLPVALMYGSLPAYRALKQGVSDGPDVTELNLNLVDLGFDPYGAITDDDHFSEATAAAVRRWQEAESLPRTGEVELGRVVFAPGARRVTALHVAVGEDPPPSGSNKPAANKPAANKPASKKPASKKPASKQNEPAASKEKEPSGSNEAAAAPKLVLGTSSTQQIVQLKVKADQQELARVGESAPVTLPNGDVTRGHITDVGTVATESSENEKEKGGNGSGGNGGGGENATISVTLALDHHVARLDKAPVSVQLVKSIRHNVLAVPATALVASAGGGYAIDVLEGARRTELPVTPGMFANGYVQIEGPAVHAGLTVMEPR